MVLGKITKSKKTAFAFAEQKIIIKNLKNDTLSNRILFYLLTGSRPSEIKCVEQIKNDYIFINGTKTGSAARWVKVSPKFSNLLKKQNEKFFNFNVKRFRESYQNFIKSIGINRKCDVYTLRHTFATNLFYLEVPDKTRSAFLGHSKTEITNDVYTTLDPTLTASDIRMLYGDLYPEF